MVKWLIQDTSRIFSAIEQEVAPLRELGIEVIPFGIIPFTTQITGLEDLDPNDDYIVRCGTKLISLLFGTETVEGVTPEVLQKIRQGVCYDARNFDQQHYSTIKCIPVLNNDSEYLDLSVEKNLYASFSTDKFVKPSSDLKAFTAGILEAGEVLKYYIENQYHRPDYAQESVLVSSVKRVNEEYRFICLEGNVVGSSRYYKNGKLNVSSEVPRNVQVAAMKYACYYMPADIYTMDLAVTDDGIKVVEYNCWNCSGLYAMDVKELFCAIHNHYVSKTISAENIK